MVVAPDGVRCTARDFALRGSLGISRTMAWLADMLHLHRFKPDAHLSSSVVDMCQYL